jgi:hypothetical protein
LRQHLVELGKLIRHAFELIDVPLHQIAFVIFDWQILEPATSRWTKEMPFISRDEIGVQKRLDSPFGSDKLGEHSHAFGNLAPTSLGGIIRYPDFRQEAGCLKLSQNLGVNFVGFDPGVCDSLHEPRICDDNSLDEWTKKSLDGSTIACNFDYDLIIKPERLGKLKEIIAQELDATLFLEFAVFEYRNLSEGTVNIHSDNTHSSPPSEYGSWRACATTTDSRSQRNRASRRGGQVTTRVLDSWSGRPAAISRSQRPYPGGPIVPQLPFVSTKGARSNIPFNNACERSLRPAVIQRKVTNGYRAMWAAEGEADVRTVVDTARLVRGANIFGAISATLGAA